MTRYRELRPVREGKRDYELVERRIKKAFKDLLYDPIAEEFTQAGTQKSAVIRAVEKGTVTFTRGVFTGRFSAETTRELKQIGATWDARTSTFRLPLADMPKALRTAVEGSEARFLERLARIDKRLSQNLPAEIAGTVKVEGVFASALWKVDRELRKTLADSLTLPPKLSAEARARIAAEWQRNLSLWIQDFAADEIVRLRKRVQQSAFAGNRYETLVKTIQRSYGVTERKAKFLARQETHLLMAKFKETRYGEAGVEEYRWRCVVGSPAHPVRPAHKALDGKVFRFDSPPITSEPGQPVRRNNAGCDYNCRCTALPLVRAT